MLSPDEVEQAAKLGHELREIEFKGPGLSTEKSFMARVARGCLALGNIRDGGHLIVGLDDDRCAFLEPGLTAEQVETWQSFDDVSRRLAEYADPPLRFDSTIATLSNDAIVAILQIFEFDSVPHVCGRDYSTANGKSIVRKGAIYVRTRRVPEASEVPDSSEMRELLDLATQKALRSYIATAERAGVRFNDEGPSDLELFERQKEAAWRR